MSASWDAATEADTVLPDIPAADYLRTLENWAQEGRDGPPMSTSLSEALDTVEGLARGPLTKTDERP